MNRRTLRDLPRERNYLAPSILSADFANLGRDVRICEEGGVELLHIDVMDGHFVPNLSMGPAILKCLRPHSRLIFDTHLMLSHPGRYVESFAKAGADQLTIHTECEDDVAAVLRQIRALGLSSGVSIKPATPAGDILPYLDLIDLVLVMTVEPGFSGGAYRSDVVPKIGEVKRLIGARPIHLEVDGGLNPTTVLEVQAQGANMYVAATSLFGAPEGLAPAIARLRQVARA